MSRFSTGSGKFIPVVSEYVHNPELGLEFEEIAKVPQQKEYIIPEVPLNPDSRPRFIQMAEEYFGRYWIITLVLLLLVLFRRK